MPQHAAPPRRSPFLPRLLLGAALAGALLPAWAADLRIGLSSDVTSLDPHFVNIAPNIAFSDHVFDTLVKSDAKGKLVPGLAESWRALSPTTWEFKLRQGVVFSDGTPLTAEDVVFSLDRPATIKNSPGPFTSYTNQIIKKEAIDAHTVHLHTASAYGPLPLDLISIYVVSKKAAENAATEDFNSGKALIGTGPFKFAAFRKGERIEVTRNERYWGKRPEWDKVTFRILASGAPRLSALLAGDVDVIENVPAADLARLKTNPQVTLAQHTTWRTLFWQLDQFRDQSPFITDHAGKPLAKNPLKDLRVRQAISKAINRQALVDRTLEGLAVPASNINAPGIFGYNDAIPMDTYDPAGARKLLAKAGYPDGFSLTIHGTNNRYINDEQVVQTVAQFLNRIGIKTKVDTQPVATYFGKARAHEYSFALLGWGSLAADFTLRAIAGTPDPDTGWGTWNWGKYSNPKVDELVSRALAAVEPAERERFARDAAGAALADLAVIPSHHQLATWGLRKGFAYDGRIDEFTFAHEIRSAR
ncbi:ABC transporter substrate-binding protein [Thauera linaloolentis]|uniref:Putative dipeptide transport binding transmembrane protein n=1 Tax=Thauera linaloolentis (strain DSM 12138 / JCM 21573 / CCUG 41526 / CIP 105981 / IAM 15112 / NBRC 102519 / 47Lol) TaxID=1123367 RepID=N6YXF2_THAL4|nr:ABC transporter substrate-binding protein [Thauera linaloolentis]ENO87087.1 putative dipeptide transport binding transmembrane protein [Thauera linaloolentis 47Lol = DSM 12138]MCM8565514.1 ABC transporter substrate-binding protein [Thauera linaloolentis]